MSDNRELLNEQHLEMMSDLTTESGGNLAEELLGHVTGEGRETLGSLISAIENQDIDTARRLAHRMKGMSSNLGMKKLQEHFRETEDRAKNGTNPPLSGEEIRELQALFVTSIEAYRSYIASDTDDD